MNDYRILVVDDEEDLCEILKFNLENEGYFVDTANSAEEDVYKRQLPSCLPRIKYPNTEKSPGTRNRTPIVITR